VVQAAFRPGTHWQQSRQDVQHSGDKNHSLSMFNFGDNVDCDEQWNMNDPATVNFRQIGFVASVSQPLECCTNVSWCTVTDMRAGKGCKNCICNINGCAAFACFFMVQYV